MENKAKFDIMELHKMKYRDMTKEQKAFYDEKKNEINIKRLSWVNEDRIMDKSNILVENIRMQIINANEELLKSKDEMKELELQLTDIAHAILFAANDNILLNTSKLQSQKLLERNMIKTEIDRLTMIVTSFIKISETLPFLQAKLDKDESLRKTRLYTPKTDFGKTLDYSNKMLIKGEE